MNLIIDAGNTAIKLAIFNHNNILFKTNTNSRLLDYSLSEIKKNKRFNINNAIISSVNDIEFKSKLINFELTKILYLNYKTPIEFINNYKTPKTLGADRIALVSAAAKKYPKKNVLVVDAGTCITFDYISSENIYFGGAISPGINLRYKSLNDYTSKLPLLKKKHPKLLTGNTTKSSIHTGVINGVAREIDGIIESYKQLNSDLTVILTGGDAKFLSDQLKNSIFVHSNFLLEGLNYILEFNIKQ